MLNWEQNVPFSSPQSRDLRRKDKTKKVINCRELIDHNRHTLEELPKSEKLHEFIFERSV